MTLALELHGESIRELTEDLRYGIFLLCVSTCISALDAAGSSIQADAKLASNLTAYLQVLKSDLAFPLLLRICLARLRRLCSVAAPPANHVYKGPTAAISFHIGSRLLSISTTGYAKRCIDPLTSLEAGHLLLPQLGRHPGRMVLWATARWAVQYSHVTSGLRACTCEPASTTHL